MSQVKIHYSQLDQDEPAIEMCKDCGSDEIRSNGDVSYCKECCSVESTETAYYGLDGEIHLESEIDWK